MVIAAAQRINVDGTANASGLAAGPSATPAQGGAGGSVRLSAVLVEGVGSILTAGGADSDSVVRSPAGPFEVQAFLNDFFAGTASTVPIRGNAPVDPIPNNLPQISIDQINTSSPLFQRFGFPNTGSFTFPDVTMPAPTTAQVQADVSISTQQVPEGTFLTVEAVGTDGSSVSTNVSVSQARALAHLTLNSGSVYQIVAAPNAPFPSIFTPPLNSFTQPWTAGWDDLSQPLDYVNSFVSYTQPASPSNSLSITYHLVGAVPNTVHQVGVHVGFGHPCPTALGQFPALTACGTITRQNQTTTLVAVELGTLTTDANGNADLTIPVNGIVSGTYELEFDVRTGICPGACGVIYQSPGPFALGTTIITIP